MKQHGGRWTFACDASGDRALVSTTARLCFDARAVDSDGEYETAFDSLSCVPGANGAFVCSRDLDAGQPCHNGEACRSGRCNYIGPNVAVCAPKLEDGEPCVAAGDCTSGGCLPSTTSANVCAPKKNEGAACGVDSDCVSGLCRQAAGQPGPVCRSSRGSANGEPCLEDDDCAARVCRRGVCWADICGDYVE